MLPGHFLAKIGYVGGSQVGSLRSEARRHIVGHGRTLRIRVSTAKVRHIQPAVHTGGRRARENDLYDVGCRWIVDRARAGQICVVEDRAVATPPMATDASALVDFLAPRID